MSNGAISKMKCVIPSSHFILPTFGGLLSLLPLQLEVPHDGDGGGDGGGRGQDANTGGHSRGDFVRPEAPSDQLEVDCLAGVSEHFDSLLISVSLDIYTIDLPRVIICEPGD